MPLSDWLFGWFHPRPRPTPPRPNPPGPAPDDFRGALLAAHNRVRDDAGLPPLAADARLDASAQGHAEFMARVGRLAHEGIGDGTPQSRAAAAGYPNLVGENAAAGYPTAAAVVNAWMGDPGHRDNILSSNYTCLGSGVRSGFWCVDFGTNWPARGAAPPGAVAPTLPFSASGGALCPAHAPAEPEPEGTPE